MEIPDHVTNCPLRSQYVAQKQNKTNKQTKKRTGHGTDWFNIGKGIHQGCILSPCLFNLYAEYIMQDTRLDESQARIKIAGRNMNNLRYIDNTTHGRK